MTTDPKKNRDLYLQYMRMSEPDYDLLSREEVQMAVAAAAPVKKSTGQSKAKKGYSCETQREGGGVAEIYLGIQSGRLSLWETGSVINWTARRDGYPNITWRTQAVVAMWRACLAWNEVMDGRVVFRYVSNLSDAAIELRYDPTGRDGLLASAFFPNEWRRDLNFVRVYRSSFDRRYSAYPLYNTMLHEIGHVLGLRHEFAHQTEQFAESILFGINNPRSVMAYYPAQEIQDSDVDSIRRAYDELEDGAVISGQGPFGTIQKRVYRVEPNN